jgi:hypothetical protein
MAYTETKIADYIVSLSLNFIANYVRDSGGLYPELDAVVTYAEQNYRLGGVITTEMVANAEDINYVASRITSIYPDLSSFDEALKAYTYAFIPQTPVPKPNGISRNMLLLGGVILLFLLLPKNSGETETPAEV